MNQNKNRVNYRFPLWLTVIFLRFADWRWAGFLAQKFVRRTELSATTKLSTGDETPPIANVLLSVVFLSFQR